MVSIYPDTLRFEDFTGFSADISVTIDWTEIGKLTVPAGVKYAVGRKFDGYAAALLKDTANAAWYGTVRVVASDPQEYRKVTVLQFNTRTTTSLTDKTLKILVPLTMPWVKVDSKLILEIKGESAKTLDYGNTTSAIDITVMVL